MGSGANDVMNPRVKKWLQNHSTAMIYVVLATIVCLGSAQALFLIKHGIKETIHPMVDLGYSVYRGIQDEAFGLDYFYGIRFAAPPIGPLRWQKPQEPKIDRSKVFSAIDYAPRCPQSYQGPTPSSWMFFPPDQVSEDCLFLNVVSPSNATGLPVFVWIHGGGYGLGDGRYNFTGLITANSQSFVAVTIQYRLGAFGFMSSNILPSFGVSNAGLYDQHFALEWVQKHISKFGGDPSRVTIAGESAGAGSVMQQVLAYGGSEGTKYFSNAIAASSYFPPQWNYDDEWPNRAYHAFVKQVGCASSPENASVFDCLSQKDTYSLQNASAYVSTSAGYGQWAFLPVVDGTFIKKQPLQQLHAGEVNGLRMLSGHNSDEAPAFVPQVIESDADFKLYIKSTLQHLSNQTHDQISSLYAISKTIPGPLYSTLGSSGPSALNQSSFAIGQQQRANNLYAERTFVCSSYWLADAFIKRDKKSWKYQYSVPPAAHGADLNAYYKPDSSLFSVGTVSAGFRTGMQLIWGRFILYGDPTLPKSIIEAIGANNIRGVREDVSAASNTSWSSWRPDSMMMLNLNTSGGTEKTLTVWVAAGKPVNVTMNVDPGLNASWIMSNASSWESERGTRCNFWANLNKNHT